MLGSGDTEMKEEKQQNRLPDLKEFPTQYQ